MIRTGLMAVCDPRRLLSVDFFFGGWCMFLFSSVFSRTGFSSLIFWIFLFSHWLFSDWFLFFEASLHFSPHARARFCVPVAAARPERDQRLVGEDSAKVVIEQEEPGEV